MNNKRKGFSRIKDLFWYSDSEPNEVLIGMCHLICLPAAIWYDFAVPNPFLLVGGMIAGAYQLYAAAWCGCLNKRLFAVQVAALIGIATCVNLYRQDLLVGSGLGWVIIAFFALWNMIRVFNEKIYR